MKKIKSFKLFESLQFETDMDIILTTVNNMLLELSFLDIETRVDLVPYVKKVAGTDIEDYPEVIVINLWKKAIKKEDYGFRASFNWDSIKDVILHIMNYLEREGFIWHRDKGSLSSGGIPIIITSGSMQFDTVRSKVEMWFIR